MHDVEKNLSRTYDQSHRSRVGSETAGARAVDGDRVPLNGGGSTSSKEAGRSRRRPVHNSVNMTMGRWTPEMSRNRAPFAVLVLSAFADIAPAGCLVVNRPAGGLVLSLVTFVVIGGLSLYSAHLVRTSLRTSGCDTLPELWKAAIGHRTACVPIFCTFLSCFTVCVGYCDLYSHLFAQVLPINPFPSFIATPQIFWLALLTMFPMAFLVMLKDINVMCYSTAVAGISSVFTLIVVAVRFLDRSYVHGGVTWEQTAPDVYVPGMLTWNDQSKEKLHGLYAYHDRGMQLFSMQAVVFLMHFNAAKYYRELQEEDKDRYTSGVGAAMGAGFVIMALTMILSFMTFGDTHHRITLDNYAHNDLLAMIARAALGAGLMGCFPLLFSAMREASVEFLNDMAPPGRAIFETVLFQNIFSAVLLVMVVAATIADHKADMTIANFGRSTFGALLVYVIPAALYVGTCRKFLVLADISQTQIVLLLIIVTFGVAMAVVSPIIWATHLY